MTQKRVFVGVSIPDGARKVVGDYINELRLRHADVRARWLAEENLHITLQFVGDLDEMGLTELDARVKHVATLHGTFGAALQGTGNFAKRRIRADALWIGIDSENDQLAAIANALGENGERTFVPHLTIARLKDGSNGHELVAEHLASYFGPVPFRISELLIYESTLLPTGSVYSVLSRHPLAG